MTLTLFSLDEPLGELRLNGDRVEVVAAAPSAADLLRHTFAYYARRCAAQAGCDPASVPPEAVLRHMAATRRTAVLRDD